ncbi:hypothetical protein ACOME3_005429 [Neoechinorhynchus agilis]
MLTKFGHVNVYKETNLLFFTFLSIRRCEIEFIEYRKSESYEMYSNLFHCKLQSFYKDYVKMIMEKWRTHNSADIMSVNYMIVRGFHEPLEAIFKEAKHLSYSDFPQLNFKDPTLALDFVKKRGEVMKLIEEKRCDEARKLINERWDNLVERNDQVKCFLCIQELLDMMTENHDPVKALKYVGENIAGLLSNYEARNKSILEVLSMVSMKKPSKSPFAALLGPRMRSRTPKEINFLLMQETERLAIKDSTGEDIEVATIDDVCLIDAYRISFSMLSMIGSLERAQRHVHVDREINISEVFPIFFQGNIPVRTANEIKERRTAHRESYL